MSPLLRRGNRGIPVETRIRRPYSMDGEDSNITLTRIYSTSNPNRGTPAHVQTCIHPSLVKTRKIGNEHIEQKLNQLYNSAIEMQKETYIATADDTPPLRAHLIAHLRHTELLTHKTASDSRPYKRCTHTMRAENTTIRSLQNWTTAHESKTNSKEVTSLLNNWPLSI